MLARTDLPRIFVQSSVFARGSGANANGMLDGGAGGLGLDRANWAAGVQVVFPNLFDFASLGARKAAAAASERASVALYDEALLTITSEQRAAAAMLAGGAGDRRPNTPVQLAAARQSETQARARYDAGLASIVEVADAQSLLAQAEVQDQLARVDVWRALLAAAAARGDLASFVESGAPAVGSSLTMWLIRAALRRPITVVVAVIAVALTAVFAVSRMRVDIFPDLDLPVIYVAQPYGGMSPAQMEGLSRQLLRVPLPLHQRHRARRVEVDPEHGAAEADVPSRHRHGAGDGGDDRLREPRARVHAAGHGRAVHHAVRRRQRAGRLSGVLERDAAASARSRTWRSNRVRPLFATLPGVSSPPPFGGSQRTIVIRVDPDRLRAYGMSPDEVIRAVTHGQRHHAVGQREHRRRDAHLAR